MDFVATRRENDEKLLPVIASVRDGSAQDALVSFAKAYLGMFYVIDNNYSAEEKVRLIANDELADAVFAGFVASLAADVVPGVKDIGEQYAAKKEFTTGYVILAGIDLYLKNDIHAIKKLPENIRAAAICFHYTNKNSVKNIWFDYLLDNDADATAQVHKQFWLAMLDSGAQFLPGIDLLLNENRNTHICKVCILPVLQHWVHCKKKNLFKLLMIAFQYSDKDEYLSVIETVIKKDQFKSEASRVYWYAMAFILAPEKHAALLSGYVGRVKLKVLPLLDFTTQVIDFCHDNNQTVSDEMVASLLRLVAPIFPPQQHVYGELGYLDINSRNVMKLFYHLACSKNSEAGNVVKNLRKARVMKIYAGVLDSVTDMQLKHNNDSAYHCPDFETYVSQLASEDKLEGRKNKFDRK